MTLTHLGAGVVVLGFVVAILFFWKFPSHPWNGFIIGFFALLAGPVIANLSDITEIVASVGGNNALTIERHIDDKAAQVQQIGDAVQALATQLQTSAKQVAQTRDLIQQEARSILELTFFILDSTQHTMPQRAFDEFLMQANKLAGIAYPDRTERIKATMRMNELMNMPLQGTPVPSPSPTP